MNLNKLIKENFEHIFPKNFSNFTNFQNEEDRYSTIILNDVIQSATINSILKNDGTNKTLKYIKSQKKFFNEFFDFYFYLFQFIDKNINEIDNLNENIVENKAIINLNLWGSEYAKKFIKFCLPALLTKNNLLFLKEKYQIEIDFYLDKNAYDVLQNNQYFKNNTQDIKINYSIIDDNIFSSIYYKKHSNKTRYFLYGALQNVSLYRSKNNNADIIFLTPDNIYSNSFLKNIVELAETKKYEVVFGSNTIRVQEESLNDNKHCNIEELNKFESDEMLNFALQNIHHDFFKHFIAVKNNHFQNSSFLINRSKNGIKMNSFWAHPYFISKKYIKEIDKFTLLPLDNKFPCKNSNFEKFKLIDDYKLGFSIDIAKKNEEHISGKYKLSSYLNFLNKEINANRFDEINYWFFSQSSYLEFKDSFDEFYYFINNNNNLTKHKYQFINEDKDIYETVLKKVNELKIRNNASSNASSIEKKYNLKNEIKLYLKKYYFINKLNQFKNKLLKYFVK